MLSTFLGKNTNKFSCSIFEISRILTFAIVQSLAFCCFAILKVVCFESASSIPVQQCLKHKAFSVLNEKLPAFHLHFLFSYFLGTVCMGLSKVIK